MLPLAVYPYREGLLYPFTYGCSHAGNEEVRWAYSRAVLSFTVGIHCALSPFTDIVSISPQRILSIFRSTDSEALSISVMCSRSQQPGWKW